MSLPLMRKNPSLEVAAIKTSSEPFARSSRFSFPESSLSSKIPNHPCSRSASSSFRSSYVAVSFHPATLCPTSSHRRRLARFASAFLTSRAPGGGDAEVPHNTGRAVSLRAAAFTVFRQRKSPELNAQIKPKRCMKVLSLSLMHDA